MVFSFVRNFFFRQHNSYNTYFFVTCNFFPQNLTLGYMTKTLNQIIFFSSTKIRIFFSATLGIFFQKKTHNPPPCKLNGSSLIRCTFCISGWKRICVFVLFIHLCICIALNIHLSRGNPIHWQGRHCRDHDRMVVGFTTTCAISV